MGLELSLFQIEDGLRDLYAMREETREVIRNCIAYGGRVSSNDAGEPAPLQIAEAELEQIDAAIMNYLRAEVKKVDGTADFILMLDRLAHEPRERKGVTERCDIDLEIDRLRARRDALREVLQNAKDNVAFVMGEMSWREGKPKKLEGVRHSLTLKGNGGVQLVEITDEAMVPDEYWRVTVTMPLVQWQTVLKRAGLDGLIAASAGTRVMREVSKSAVAEALNFNCFRCDGNGVVEPWGELDEDADYRAGENPCGACGGSGKQGVPGARLLERGQSVVIK